MLKKVLEKMNGRIIVIITIIEVAMSLYKGFKYKN